MPLGGQFLRAVIPCEGRPTLGHRRALRRSNLPRFGDSFHPKPLASVRPPADVHLSIRPDAPHLRVQARKTATVCSALGGPVACLPVMQVAIVIEGYRRTPAPQRPGAPECATEPRRP